MRKLVLLALGSMLLMSAAKPSTLEKCLISNPNQVQACVDETIPYLTLSTCYNEAEQIKSQHLQESLKSFCFYKVSEFPTLNKCLEKSNLFFLAENHDAAAFSCYTNFQENIKKAECLKIANSLKIPEKKTYLKTHCQTL